MRACGVRVRGVRVQCAMERLAHLLAEGSDRADAADTRAESDELGRGDGAGADEGG